MTAKEALKIHSRQYGQPLKGVLLEAVADLEEQATEITSLKAELETERMRLATCGVAAIGYFTGCKDEYRSASLEDTLNLYKVNQELREQLVECKKDAERLMHIHNHFDVLVTFDEWRIELDTEIVANRKRNQSDK